MGYVQKKDNLNNEYQSITHASLHFVDISAWHGYLLLKLYIAVLRVCIGPRNAYEVDLSFDRMLFFCANGMEPVRRQPVPVKGL